MDSIYDRLTDRALSLLQSANGNRVVIAIAGPPGSAKSTISAQIENNLNAQQPGVAKTVPMDGYHLTRHQLDCMPDPHTAHERRGSPWTFDSHGVVNMVKELVSKQDSTLAFPSFDHKLKDPVELGVVVPPSVKIILLEGLYLLLCNDPWSQISDLAQDKWFITVSPSVGRMRVAKRHVAAGIMPNLELALKRVDSNDAINGRLVMKKSMMPSLVVDTEREILHELT